jgi:putative DNA-invertase from lambdoid prophage Rac
LARPKALRAGLYARVSTHDQQTLPMQLRTMGAYAKQRGWIIGMEVRDVGSGANVRPQREAMLKAARRRELDIIVVWRLDRSIAA